MNYVSIGNTLTIWQEESDPSDLFDQLMLRLADDREGLSFDVAARGRHGTRLRPRLILRFSSDASAEAAKAWVKAQFDGK